jgi:hypothetical protein
VTVYMRSHFPLPIVYHTLVHLQTMSSPRASSVRIEPVSDPSELHTLASVFDMAIRASGDKFREVLMRYVEDPYKETMKHLEAAQVDEHSLEQHFLFKAVMTVPKYSAGDCRELGWGNAGGVLPETLTEEKIVGMAHWTVGYINLPKVDPFEQQTVASFAPATTDEPSTEATPLREPVATSAETITDSKPESDTQSFDFYAVCRKPVRNTYISQIRGKKHVCKSCHNPSLRQLLFKALSKPSSLPANAIHPPSFSYTLQIFAALPSTPIINVAASRADSYNGVLTSQTRRSWSVI